MHRRMAAVGQSVGVASSCKACAQRFANEAANRDAGYAPHHHLYGRADWRFVAGWLLSGQVNHVADYTTIDLSMAPRAIYVRSTCSL